MKQFVSRHRERIVMGILAAALLILGIPQIPRTAGRLAAGFDRKDDLKPSELRGAAEQAERLARDLADPQGSLRGGLLRLKIGLPSTGPADEEALKKAAADLEQGLARVPADAQAWAALAHADLALSRPEAAAKALSAGLFASHADPYLNPSWCVLGVALWPVLGEPDQARIATEIRWAWRDHRPLILTLASTDAHYSSVLRASLDESERAEFDRRLQASGGAP